MLHVAQSLDAGLYPKIFLWEWEMPCARLLDSNCLWSLGGDWAEKAFLDDQGAILE